MISNLSTNYNSWTLLKCWMGAQGRRTSKWLGSFKTPLTARNVLQLVMLKVWIPFANGGLVGLQKLSQGLRQSRNSSVILTWTNQDNALSSTIVSSGNGTSIVWDCSSPPHFHRRRLVHYYVISLTFLCPVLSFIVQLQFSYL